MVDDEQRLEEEEEEEEEEEAEADSVSVRRTRCTAVEAVEEAGEVEGEAVTKYPLCTVALGQREHGRC